jgi:hypothetical protein
MKNVGAIWDKARKHFHYPSLKEPKVVKGLDGGACYDFKRRETLVDENFIKEVAKLGKISTDEALEGTLVHEISHYMDFPKTLGTLVLAAHMIDLHLSKGNLDQETSEFILQTYCDMAADLASVLQEDRTEPVLKLRRALQEVLDDKLNNKVRGLMLAYLCHQAQQPYELDEDLKQHFEDMKKIKFQSDNTTDMRLGLHRWGTIVLELLEKHGGSCGCDGHSDSNVRVILERATDGEMREALREISGRITKGEFEKVKEWLKDKGGRLPKLPKGARTIGTSGGELPVDLEVIEYYKMLSTNYPLVVSKKLLETDTTIRSWSEMERWRPGADPNLALPHTSGGYYLPGVTKSIRIAENPIRSTDYKVPHLLIVIDTSGSMDDPKARKSFAVLGAYCAARSYHIHGSSIGVINFSGESFYLPYTREIDDALGAVSAYQGGGTVADVEMIRKMLGPEMAELYAKNPERNLRDLPREAIKKEIEIGVPEEVFAAESIDVVMITDGGIFNLDEVLDLFEEKAQLNRATIVLVKGFMQEVMEIERRKINIHRLDKPLDIPDLLIRETSKNFAAFAGEML